MHDGVCIFCVDTGTRIRVSSHFNLCEILLNMENLEHLNLGGQRSVNDNGCRHLCRLSNLISLVLLDTSVSDFGIAKLANLTRLTFLDASWTMTSGPPFIGALRYLALNHCCLKSIRDYGGAAHLLCWPRLQQVDLRGADVNNENHGWELLSDLVR